MLYLGCLNPHYSPEETASVTRQQVQKALASRAATTEAGLKILRILAPARMVGRLALGTSA